MRKLLASLLFLVAVGGPVTVALAATDDAPTLRSTAAGIDRGALSLETRSLAARGDAAEQAAAAERRHQRRQQRAPGHGGGGAYRGKYQFSRATWASTGGSGDPVAAPEAEQDRRAAMLYAREGAGHWPVCG